MWCNYSHHFPIYSRGATVLLQLLTFHVYFRVLWKQEILLAYPIAPNYILHFRYAQDALRFAGSQSNNILDAR